MYEQNDCNKMHGKGWCTHPMPKEAHDLLCRNAYCLMCLACQSTSIVVFQPMRRNNDCFKSMNRCQWLTTRTSNCTGFRCNLKQFASSQSSASSGFLSRHQPMMCRSIKLYSKCHSQPWPSFNIHLSYRVMKVITNVLKV